MIDRDQAEFRPVRFTEEQAHSILKRAVELHELRGTQWDVDDLVVVARELGIDERTVHEAIAEVQRTRPSPHLPRVSGWLESAALFGFGAASFIPVAIWDFNALPSIVTVGITSVMLSLDSEVPDSTRRYLWRNGALWAGFWAGGSTQFFMTDPVLFVVMSAPVVGGLCSMTLVKLIRRLRPSARPPVHGSLIGRVAARVKGWLRIGESKDPIIDRTAEYILTRHAVI